MRIRDGKEYVLSVLPTDFTSSKGTMRDSTIGLHFRAFTKDIPFPSIHQIRNEWNTFFSTHETKIKNKRESRYHGNIHFPMLSI